MREGWHAELELGFRQNQRRTQLAHRRQRGPLAVQRPFYPEGGLCHVYLLHPPGGLVGGDRLDIRVQVEPGASALITTPGATKFYRSAGQQARQRQRLQVEGDGCLEWFPQENILFPGADASIATEVELARSARFIGWEILCLGRPANNERFEHGQATLGFELRRDGRPLLLERLKVHGDAQLKAAAGLRGYPVTATLVATPCNDRQLTMARDALPGDIEGIVGITRVDNVLVCRFLGHQAEQARRCFIPVWGALREAMIGRTACPPRIWAT